MKKILLISFLSILFSHAFSQSAIRAKQYAREYGKQLMLANGTSDATNLNIEIIDADTEGSDYVLEIEVSWDDIEGAIIKDPCHCVINGVLTVASDGTKKRFSETSRNDGIKKIQEGKQRAKIINKLGEKVIEMQLNSEKSYNYSDQSNKSTYSYSESTDNSEELSESEINGRMFSIYDSECSYAAASPGRPLYLKQEENTKENLGSSFESSSEKYPGNQLFRFFNRTDKSIEVYISDIASRTIRKSPSDKFIIPARSCFSLYKQYFGLFMLVVNPNSTNCNPFFTSISRYEFIYFDDKKNISSVCEFPFIVKTNDNR